MVFPGKSKPKHHFLIHYPSVLKACGPFWKFCAMRFEGKHQEGKKTSKTTVCRVNITRTIAIKHQLILNHRFLKNNNSSTDNNFKYQQVLLSTLPCIQNFQHLLPSNIKNLDMVSCTKKINLEGREITVDCMLMIPSGGGPLFLNVKQIFLTSNENFIVVGKQLRDIY